MARRNKTRAARDMAMLGRTERQQIAQALKESLAPSAYPVMMKKGKKKRNGKRDKDNPSATFLSVDGNATPGDPIIVNGRRLWRRHRAKPCAAEGCAGNAKAGGVCRKHRGHGKSGKEDNGSRPGRTCGCSATAGPGKLACTICNAKDVCVVQGIVISSTRVEDRCSINSLAVETYRRLSNNEGTVVVFYRVGHDGSPAKDVQPAWVLPDGAVEWDEGAPTAPTAPTAPPLLEKEKEEKEEEDDIASNNSTPAPAPGGGSVASSVSVTTDDMPAPSGGGAASVDSADVASTPTGADVKIETTAYEKHPPHRKKCVMEGCRNVANSRGLCVRHARRKGVCSAAGCDRTIARRGLCTPHGAYGTCTISDCKTAAIGMSHGKGQCQRHGGKRQRVCMIEGCTTPSRARNLCGGHGAYGRCQIDGCSTALGSGTSYCGTHGGRKTKPCIEPGCNTGAQRNRRCKRHGAYGWCKFDGCTISARQGFVHCIRHGGGKKPKQCSVAGCITFARTRTVCKKHDVMRAKSVSVGAQLNA